MNVGFWPALGWMLLSFVILAKCADWFVEGAIGVAQRLRMPPILIGIVVVSLGTTAPELAVSVRASLKGEAAMALGNAVGSVIYDDGLALALAALLAPVPILIDRTVLRSSGLFLIVVQLAAYAFCLNGILERGEGAILVLAFVGYLLYSYWEQRRNHQQNPELLEELEILAHRRWRTILLLFGGGLTGVFFSSEWIVDSATIVAIELGVPSVIVALAAVALGTSIPEVATCIIAARKGQGSLAVGNILGADILNICWIAGASAVVNPLVVERAVINFMFPSMLVIVFAMLAMMRFGHQLKKWHGVVLLSLLVVYLVLLFVVNPGAAQPA